MRHLVATRAERARPKRRVKASTKLCVVDGESVKMMVISCMQDSGMVVLSCDVDLVRRCRRLVEG